MDNRTRNEKICDIAYELLPHCINNIDKFINKDANNLAFLFAESYVNERERRKALDAKLSAKLSAKQ